MGITNVVKVNRPVCLADVIAERDALATQLDTLRAAAEQPKVEAPVAVASAQAHGLRTVAIDLAMALVAVLQSMYVVTMLMR